MSKFRNEILTDVDITVKAKIKLYLDEEEGKRVKDYLKSTLEALGCTDVNVVLAIEVE